MYTSNAPLIYRFMFWRTKDEMLADDLTSNVFEKAWRMRGSFKGGSTKAWLYKIAHNTLVDYWRKKKDLPADDAAIAELVSDNTALDEALDQEMLVAIMQEAVAKLPAEMRTVVELRFIKGLSARQTAMKLGLSEANVRVIQYRALRKLRDYIQLETKREMQ